MKTHDMASQLEKYARLLRSAKNIEIDDVLATLLSLTIKGGKQDKERAQKQLTFPPDIHDRLGKMSPAEICEYINSVPEFSTAASVHSLAKELKIAASNRQNRDALVNLIVRHFEARQMDSIIRTTNIEKG